MLRFNPQNVEFVGCLIFGSGKTAMVIYATKEPEKKMYSRWMNSAKNETAGKGSVAELIPGLI